MNIKQKTATIVKKTEYNDRPAYYILFKPGLPYDENTKGTPHKNAWCVETTVLEQDYEEDPTTNISSTHLTLCTGKQQPDLTYILSRSKRFSSGMKSLNNYLKALGYELIDKVEKSMEDLRKSGLNKLTEREKAALGHINSA